MGDALEKWRGQGDGLARVKTGEGLDSRLLDLQRCQLVRRQGGRQEPPAPHVVNELLHAGVPVDLPRFCAVHNCPYCARYVYGADGHFHHGQEFKVTDDLYRSQYTHCGGIVGISANELAEEWCPWCGAHGFGAVFCGSCGREVCYGKTTTGYFRCACGNEAKITPTLRKVQGVIPRLPGRGGFATTGE